MRSAYASNQICTREQAAESFGIEPEEFVGGVNLVKASRLLGIAPSTLRQRALQGRIGAQRDGRRWIFTWQDLLGYAQGRRLRGAGLAATDVLQKTPPNSGGGCSPVISPAVRREAAALGLIASEPDRSPGQNR